jgi:hypothetical protein
MDSVLGSWFSVLDFFLTERGLSYTIHATIMALSEATSAAARARIDGPTASDNMPV